MKKIELLAFFMKTSELYYSGGIKLNECI